MGQVEHLFHCGLVLVEPSIDCERILLDGLLKRSGKQGKLVELHALLAEDFLKEVKEEARHLLPRQACWRGLADNALHAADVPVAALDEEDIHRGQHLGVVEPAVLILLSLKPHRLHGLADG